MKELLDIMLDLKRGTPAAGWVEIYYLAVKIRDENHRGDRVNYIPHDKYYPL
jgi:hypothetical protein